MLKREKKSLNIYSKIVGRESTGKLQQQKNQALLLHCSLFILYRNTRFARVEVKMLEYFDPFAHTQIS